MDHHVRAGVGVRGDGVLLVSMLKLLMVESTSTDHKNFSVRSRFGCNSGYIIAWW